MYFKSCSKAECSVTEFSCLTNRSLHNGFIKNIITRRNDNQQCMIISYLTTLSTRVVYRHSLTDDKLNTLDLGVGSESACLPKVDHLGCECKAQFHKVYDCLCIGMTDILVSNYSSSEDNHQYRLLLSQTSTHPHKQMVKISEKELFFMFDSYDDFRGHGI